MHVSRACTVYCSTCHGQRTLENTVSSMSTRHARQPDRTRTAQPDRRPAQRLADSRGHALKTGLAAPRGRRLALRAGARESDRLDGCGAAATALLDSLAVGATAAAASRGTGRLKDVCAIRVLPSKVSDDSSKAYANLYGSASSSPKLFTRESLSDCPMLLLLTLSHFQIGAEASPGAPRSEAHLRAAPCEARG